MSSKTGEMFLIEKRGLYYRPDACGYTGLKRDAGRYSFDEAVERVGPNGPEGPQDGLGMWREAEAPEFSTRCSWDLRVAEKARKEALNSVSYPAIQGFLDRHVLQRMAESNGAFGPLETCWSIASFTNEWLTRDIIRGVLRSLTDRGFCFYARGLFDEDGEVAGAGYGLTQEGMDYYGVLCPREAQEPTFPISGGETRVGNSTHT